MKKISAILAVEVAYLLALHFIFSFIFHLHLHANTLSTTTLSIFIEEIPIIMILILLNTFIWKQKILFARYPIWKTLGLASYGLIAFSVAAIFSLVTQLNIGAFFLLFIATLLIGVNEELLMRGLVLGSLIKKGKSLGFSILISSILFGLLHSINAFDQPVYNTVLQVLYVIPMGVFLAVLYLKSNNLLLPIFVHAMQDFMAIILSGGKSSSNTTSFSSVLIFYVICLTLAALFYFTGPQQVANFKARLLGRSLQKVEKKLTARAKDTSFRRYITVSVLIYGLIAYGFNLLAGKLQPSGEIAGFLASQEATLMLLSISAYVFLILYFDYKLTNLCWLLIPVAGGPAFAILALSETVQPKFYEKN